MRDDACLFLLKKINVQVARALAANLTISSARRAPPSDTRSEPPPMPPAAAAVTTIRRVPPSENRSGPPAAEAASMGMGRARNFGGPDVSDGGVVGSSHHLAGALVASLALSSRRALSLADNGQVFFSKKW